MLIWGLCLNKITLGAENKQKAAKHFLCETGKREVTLLGKVELLTQPPFTSPSMRYARKAYALHGPTKSGTNSQEIFYAVRNNKAPKNYGAGDYYAVFNIHGHEIYCSKYQSETFYHYLKNYMQQCVSKNQQFYKAPPQLSYFIGLHTARAFTRIITIDQAGLAYQVIQSSQKLRPLLPHTLLATSLPPLVPCGNHR